jgi:catalase
MTPKTDDHGKSLAQDLIHVLDTLNGGVHPGYRPAHAKGIMLRGVFTPAPAASSLTRAPHVAREFTPITVRFSDSTGIPNIPDNDPNAIPKGIAIRFHLAEHVHTDIIGQAHDGFPVRTPEEFLEMLQAVAASGPNTANPPRTGPSPIEAFLGGHPAALKYVTAPKPLPSSFAREAFFGVNAFKFTNKDGRERYGRYRIRPEAGTEYLDAAAAASKSPNFLFDDIKERIARGPVKLDIVVQLAESGDTVDDATAHWPDGRTEAAFGSVALNAVIPEEDENARRVIFDPIPRVDGIEPSGDPLLDTRADVYLASGRRRRAGAK